MAPRLRDLVTRNLTLKLVALVLAILLWAVVRADSPTRVTLPDVPVEVIIDDPTWSLAGAPAPATVTVIVSAPYRSVVRLAVSRPRVVVPIEQVTDTAQVIVLQARWVRLDGGADGVRIEDVRPGSVRLAFDRTETRPVAVVPEIHGRLPDGYILSSAQVDPPVTRVTGPVRRLALVDTLSTWPIDLSGLRESRGFTVPVDTAGFGDLEFVPDEVLVRINVMQVAPEPEPVDTPETPEVDPDDLLPPPEVRRPEAGGPPRADPRA